MADNRGILLIWLI